MINPSTPTFKNVGDCCPNPPPPRIDAPVQPMGLTAPNISRRLLFVPLQPGWWVWWWCWRRLPSSTGSTRCHSATHCLASHLGPTPAAHARCVTWCIITRTCTVLSADVQYAALMNEPSRIDFIRRRHDKHTTWQNTGFPIPFIFASSSPSSS